MSVYVPKVNAKEKHLHIREMMHQTLSNLMKDGKLKLSAGPKAKFPKLKLSSKFKGIK